MSKKYRSDAMAAIHETMEALHKQTMRRFDDACLTPIRPLAPEDIKAVREREHVSQTVFANYLNVTSSLVSKWERGRKAALRASLKLLSLVGKNGLAAAPSNSRERRVSELIDTAAHVPHPDLGITPPRILSPHGLCTSN